MQCIFNIFIRPCREDLYDMHASYAKFPSSVAAAYWWDELNKTLSLDESNGKVTPHLIKSCYESLVAVDIFYSRIGYVQQVQIPANTRSSLLADIGGQVGLWLGVSIVSVYEVLQLCLVNIFRFGKKRRMRNKSVLKKFQSLQDEIDKAAALVNSKGYSHKENLEIMTEKEPETNSRRASLRSSSKWKRRGRLSTRDLDTSLSSVTLSPKVREIKEPNVVVQSDYEKGRTTDSNRKNID